MPTTLEQIQYGFDRDSRRTWQKRPLSTTQDQAYQYDALSQVSTAARGSLNLNATAVSGIPSLEESWNYDPTGNWRGYHTAANGSSTLNQHRVHDRGNRLTQIEDNPHNQVLDRAGRVRQTAPDASGDWNGKLEMTWDAWSRITQVKNNGSVAGEYTYDGLFRRVTREVDSETIHSYYNAQWRPVEERKDAETTASKSCLWGSRHRDDLVRRDRAVGGTTLNETRYILMDYFNPAAITDAAGVVTERYAFSAFGVRTILNPDYTARSSSECAMEFSFQGQFLDLESGLMNYGYRYYSPYLGRWTCKDPIGEEGSLNLYLAVGNNAVSRVDLFGLLDVDVRKAEDVGTQIKYIFLPANEGGYTDQLFVVSVYVLSPEETGKECYTISATLGQHVNYVAVSSNPDRDPALGSNEQIIEHEAMHIDSFGKRLEAVGKEFESEPFEFETSEQAETAKQDIEKRLNTRAEEEKSKEGSHSDKSGQFGTPKEGTPYKPTWRVGK